MSFISNNMGNSLNMNLGDRWCPECDTISLVEKGLEHWKCLNPLCEIVIHNEDLDAEPEW